MGFQNCREGGDGAVRRRAERNREETEFRELQRRQSGGVRSVRMGFVRLGFSRERERRDWEIGFSVRFVLCELEGDERRLGGFSRENGDKDQAGGRDYANCREQPGLGGFANC
ncbi:hypothetical protein KFK09_003884 [Dendrobium nobile]|uniref:Uncharacterized protein n=1 Tax=Dendrobium nobile TaxID=94219 RepID=A0A8T3BYT4_DENNO|nr:hypothetical protein KFK09_003884 [Dendrobium nobile]